MDALPVPEILHWDCEEGNKDIRTYNWLSEHDYLIVMKKFKDGQRRLGTALYIDDGNRHRQLLRKYEI